MARTPRRAHWTFPLLALCLAAPACAPAPSPASAPEPGAVTVTPAPTAASRASASPDASPPSPATARAWPGAAQVQLDGIRLGDRYGSAVKSRVPYDAPCDDDPIDKQARRFMVYGAEPCRGRSFPEGTTVMFYLRFAEGADELEQPIEAIAWLGGTWFSTRSDFPVRVGEPASRAAAALGPVEKAFRIARKDVGLTVQRHAGQVHSVVDVDRLVGFVVGPMPDDPESEQWRGLMQMWTRYTKPVRSAGAP